MNLRRKFERSIRMLKKSIHGFFNNGLSEVNSVKPHKLLDFQVSQFGNPSLDCLAGCFFNNLISS